MLVAIITGLTGLVLLFAAAALWIWWWRRRYTRERFAFTGLGLIGALALLVITSLLTQAGPWDILLHYIYQVTGVEPERVKPTVAEHILAILTVIGCGWFILIIHEHWDGLRSVNHEQRSQERQPTTILLLAEESLLFLQGLRDPSLHKLQKYHPEEWKKDSVLQGVEANLAWHHQARELWLLRSKSYQFDEAGWHDQPQCWVGQQVRTGQRAILACTDHPPLESDIRELLAYRDRIAREQDRTTGVELIVAVKNGDLDENRRIEGQEVRILSENHLLDGLVDFRDYFREIQRRVLEERLPESDLTIHHIYTPSRYQLSKKGTPKGDLEGYIHQWLGESSRRQLALLGEYGQGKSTASLMLSYELIERIGKGEPARIPILIELRGKSPRNLAPLDLLAAWAGPYGIDPRSVMKLAVAGRLLLIFEGFDEVDLAGDSESRLNHFRTLWQLSYPSSKILITGRPNFFLDEPELQAALGIREAELGCPHCQALYLASFDTSQIEHSLRNIDADVRHGIVALARRNQRFLDLAGRPSLLYIIATVWRQPEFAAHREHMTSALVMDFFIRNSYRRQGAKGKDSDAMALNTPERDYFMQGIAAYMLINDLPNQITTQQLDEVVRTLIRAIPDEVSRLATAMEGETRNPLRRRQDLVNNEPAAVEHVKTDVRACGLLVSDLSRVNAFKFGHKSFMEFLAGKLYALGLLQDELPVEQRRVIRSLLNSFPLPQQKIAVLEEVMVFCGEWLGQQVVSEGRTQLQAAHKLFDILFRRQQILRRFWSNRLLTGLQITGWMSHRWGWGKAEQYLMWGKLSVAFAFAFASIIAGASALAVLGVVAVIAALEVTRAHANARFNKLTDKDLREINMTNALADKLMYMNVDDIAYERLRERVDENARLNAHLRTLIDENTRLLAGLRALADVSLALISLFILLLLLKYYSGLMLVVLFLGYLGGVLAMIQYISLPKGLLEGRRRRNSNSSFASFRFWYTCCRLIKLDDRAIASVIGEKAMVLFEPSKAEGLSHSSN